MILKRVSRTLVTVGLSISLALGLIAVPAVTLAALPNWVGVSAVALPDTVTPGQAAGYSVTIKNNGPGNISQLFLFTKDGTETVVYTNPSQGSCPGLNGHLYCTLGALRAGQDVTVVAAFATSTVDTGQRTVTFQWNTTGLGSGSGDNSHGDTLDQPVTTTFSSDATNFAGRFVVTNTDKDKTVKTGDTPTGTDKQTTVVYSPETGIGVTVDDSVGCPTTSACFGQISEISVANGKSYTAGFKVVVNLHSSGIPNGVNANTIEVFHDGVEIVNKCGTTPTPDCFSAKKMSWGIQVTVWLHHNGKLTMG